MKLKRFSAYIIDIIIISFISSFIFTIAFKDKIEDYSNTSQEYMKKITKKEELNEKELNDIGYKFSKSTQTLTIITISTQIVYAIFLQYFLNGQTLGKKIMKIRIVSEKEKKLNPSLFVLRESIFYLIPLKIIDIICLMVLKKTYYLSVTGIINDINSIIYIAIIGTIIFRKDERGLHEIISKTKVIEDKKNAVKEK